MIAHYPEDVGFDAGRKKMIIWSRCWVIWGALWRIESRAVMRPVSDYAAWNGGDSGVGEVAADAVAVVDCRGRGGWVMWSGTRLSEMTQKTFDWNPSESCQ